MLFHEFYLSLSVFVYYDTSIREGNKQTEVE